MTQDQVVAFEVTGPADLEDLAVTACWEAGTLGLEELEIDAAQFRLRAYFSKAPGEAAEAMRQLSGVRVRGVGVPDVDWVERFRESFTAFRVGPFGVLPAWQRDTLPGSIPLLVDPGQAFGTGTHETTRLCLTALTRVDSRVLSAATVLDLGAGSGILSIAASRLGAGVVIAVEVDLDAAIEARRHADLNQVDLPVVNGDLATSLRDGCADIVLANIQAPLLVGNARRLCDVLRPGGLLVLSGLLSGDADEIQSLYGRSGETRRYADGDWVAIEVRL